MQFRSAGIQCPVAPARRARPATWYQHPGSESGQFPDSHNLVWMSYPVDSHILTDTCRETLKTIFDEQVDPLVAFVDEQIKSLEYRRPGERVVRGTSRQNPIPLSLTPSVDLHRPLWRPGFISICPRPSSVALQRANFPQVSSSNRPEDPRR